MNWLALLETLLKSMPALIPNLLRALADELEKNPDLLAALVRGGHK